VTETTTTVKPAAASTKSAEHVAENIAAAQIELSDDVYAELTALA